MDMQLCSHMLFLVCLFAPFIFYCWFRLLFLSLLNYFLFLGSDFQNRSYLRVVVLKGFTDAGVVVDSFTGPTLVFAKNGRLIADGKAVAMTLSPKGNGGLMPCHLCANVLMQGALSDPDSALDNTSGTLVELTHPTLQGCIANTNE